MIIVLCSDRDWLLSQEAYMLYAPCMYHPAYGDFKKQIVYFWIDIENAAVQITGMVYEKRDQIAFLNEMQFSD